MAITQDFILLDYIALFFFIALWFGYAAFTRRKSKKQQTLLSVMQQVRAGWVESVVCTERKSRVPDAQLINVLHRGVSFFVSTTVLIIAGLLAAISYGDSVVKVIAEFPFASTNAAETWRPKIMIITVLFVVCFFRMTWALRQNQYVSIVLLSIPNLSNQLDLPKTRETIENISRIFTDSGDNFNHGLRGYYFGLSMFSWLIGPYYCIAAILYVVLILYRREYRSLTLELLGNIVKK